MPHPRVAPRLLREALVALLLTGCPSLDGGEGRPFECSCHYLTDFDDASKVDVSICAAPDRAVGEAKNCAQPAAPAPIQTCTCTPAASAPPCRPGACITR